jgi:hypothetical protein
MSLPIKHPSIRTWCLPIISAAVTVVAAAAVDPEQNWARLRSLSSERRAKLIGNLKNFDLLYARSKQDSLRELDRRIHAFPPEQREHYLAVLRRYHNWLNQLPENKQDELNELPPAERMAAVNKLVIDYPIPKTSTPRFLQMVDVGEYSPFELASLYLVWQAMTPQKRAQVERMSSVQKRHDEMQIVADQAKIPHEVKPPEFDDARWAKQYEDFVKAKRPTLVLNDLKKKKEEAVRNEILRREAITYYFLEFPRTAVTPERLADFLAGFPPWLKTVFDHHPPDEARRRLTIVYRLVFPAPAEIKPTVRPTTAGAATRPAPGQADRSSRPPGKPASKSGNSPF